MNWQMLAKLANELLQVCADILWDERMPKYATTEPTPVAACERCGEVPFIVRWGTIRIGQELDGFYYQATAGGPPILLCRSCWHASIGTQDPLAPRKA